MPNCARYGRKVDEAGLRLDAALGGEEPVDRITCLVPAQDQERAHQVFAEESD